MSLPLPGAGARLAIAASFAAVACVSTTADPPGPIRFEAHASGIAFRSQLPAEATVALGSTGSVFSLAADALSDRGVWSLRVTLTRDEMLAGHVDAAVGPSTIAPALLQISGSQLVKAESGMLDMTFGHGQTSGTIGVTSPGLLDSAFNGELNVSCWIPNGTPEGGPEALVLDDKLETDACRPFQILR